ncbi:tripartite tricarboxylate transporter permease, partial [Kerstersia similis]|uniref:tripartite tricarboxylate transporter permease n=1 Tax=Kerstersia similis TaxID=206505 RepID=UPI0039EED319
MNDALQYFLIAWTDPKLLMMAAIGTFAGIYIGAIPGLSVTMAVSILISFTFKWPVNEALVLIAGIYLGGVYGGSRASILLNIPGGPAQIATSLDGYPIAKRGEAGLAIGLTTVVSVIGGFIAIAVLAIAAPVVSEFALTFGPREYLLLAAWGLLLVGSLSGGSISKGMFAGALGVLIGSVGLDPLTAQPRFTFGSLELTAGISYIAAMIGFFGVAEILAQLHELNAKTVKQNVSKIIPPWKMIRKYLPLTVRSSAVGIGVG